MFPDFIVGLCNFLFQCSSASRKFLNRAADVRTRQRKDTISVLFSEPKIPQSSILAPNVTPMANFSALQRAENSSMRAIPPARASLRRFQCSSASRKFLNRISSLRSFGVGRISVLFSEPKIPQWAYIKSLYCGVQISVLFSEPKIPQLQQA